MVVDEQPIDEVNTNSNNKSTENKENNEVEESLNSTETLDSELTEDDEGEESIELDTSEDEDEEGDGEGEGEGEEEGDSFQSLPKDIEDIKDVILEVNISQPEIFDYSSTLKNHFMKSNQTDENDLSLLENEIVRWQTGAVDSSSGEEDNEDSDPEEEPLPEAQEIEQTPQRAKRREHYDMLDDFIDDSEAPKPSELTERDLKNLKMKNFSIRCMQGAFRKLTLKKPVTKGSRSRAKPQSANAGKLNTPSTNANANGSSKPVKEKKPKQINTPVTSADQGKTAIVINESGSEELSDLTTWTPSPPPALFNPPDVINSLLPVRRALSPSAPDRDGNISKLSKSKKSKMSNPSTPSATNVLTGPAKRKAISNTSLSHIQNTGKNSKLPISSIGPSLLNASDSDTSTLSDISAKGVRSPIKSPPKLQVIEPQNTKATPARSNRMRANRMRAPPKPPVRQPVSGLNDSDPFITRPNIHIQTPQDSYNRPPNPAIHASSNVSNIPPVLNSTQGPVIKDSNSPDRRQKLSSIASLLSSDPPEDMSRQQSYKPSFVKSVQSSIEYMLNDPRQNLPPSIQNQVQESIQQNGGSIPEHQEYKMPDKPLININNNSLSQQNSNPFESTNSNSQKLAPPSNDRSSSRNSPLVKPSNCDNIQYSISPSRTRSQSQPQPQPQPQIQPQSQSQLLTQEVKPSPTKKSSTSRKSTAASQKTSRLTRSNSKKVAQNQIYTYVISDED